jgi:hypothetical protein
MPAARAMQVSGTPTFIIGTLDADDNLMSVKKTVVDASPSRPSRQGSIHC